MTTPHQILDLTIVGGGPAGLSAALVAGRARLSTLVLDAENPRNAITHATHGFFTQDGTAPNELRRLGREQLAKYSTVQWQKGRVSQVLSKQELMFEVTTLAGKTWLTRRVLLATGWRDNPKQSEIPGLSDVYGRSVFPCPFCDGYELSERKLAVFVGGKPESAVTHYLAMVAVLSSPNYTVFTHGSRLPEETKAVLEQREVCVVESPIHRLISENGKLVAIETTKQERIFCEGGFVLGDFSEPASPLAEQLGVEHSPHPFGWLLPETNELGATSLKGFYIAGDARSGFSGLSLAAAQGSRCASGIVGEVAMERWNGV